MSFDFDRVIDRRAVPGSKWSKYPPDVIGRTSSPELFIVKTARLRSMPPSNTITSFDIQSRLLHPNAPFIELNVTCRA